MSSQYGELRPTSSYDRFTSLGHRCKFQRVSRLGSVTARQSIMSVSQTLRRWTEGATYVRQGDHHVGHWPTFLVLDWIMCEINNSCLVLSCSLFRVLTNWLLTKNAPLTISSLDKVRWSRTIFYSKNTVCLYYNAEVAVNLYRQARQGWGRKA